MKIKVNAIHSNIPDGNDYSYNEAYAMRSFEEAISNVRNSINLGDAANNYSVIGAYSSIYQKISYKRKEIIRSVDEISAQYYLVDVVVNQICEDALSPEIGTNEIFNIKCPKNPKIQKILTQLEKDLNLDDMVVDIAPDLIKYGEYVLENKLSGDEEFIDTLNKQKFEITRKVKKKNKGIVAIRDIVEQGTVVGLTQDGENHGYLALTPDMSRIVKRDAACYTKFVLSGAKVRIKLEDFIPELMTANKKVQEILKSLPRFLRIGRSMIYPFISKFKESELLEKLVPATKLSKLSNVNLVGVQVPNKYDLNSGFEVAKRMENYINNKIGVDQRLGEITVESILSVAGRTKVLPLFGDKGQVEKLDYQSSEPDELLASVKETREVILDSIGVPYELIYKSDSDSKGEILKRNAKYVRKLKNVQRSIAEGVKSICATHLYEIGETDFDIDDIEVEFLNKLVEVDNTARLEHSDITMSTLNNIVQLFKDYTEEGHFLREAVDLNAVAHFIDRNLKTIGLADAIKTRNEEGPDLNKIKELDKNPEIEQNVDSEETEDEEDLDQTDSDGEPPSETD